MSSTNSKNSMSASALAVGAAVGALGMQAAKRLSGSSSLRNLTNGMNGIDLEQNGQRQRTAMNDKNVGILAIEVYTPSAYISQSDLEEHSGVSKGKYTLGLGQEGLGICGDAEDVNSLALTVVHSLLEK